MPSSSIIFFANRLKIPPDELCNRISLSIIYAPKDSIGVRIFCGFITGHIFVHRLQLMHFSESTLGYKKPSLSASIFMHCVGQHCAHALHPQQSSFLWMLIIFFALEKFLFYS